jgi:N-acetylglutamate synthase-like GNAT family acetyltransferase
MSQIVIRPAVGPSDIATIRALMQAYGQYLADNPGGAENICLEGYARELEKLPEGYILLLLAFVDGQAAGCVALREIHRDERSCEMKRLFVPNAFRGFKL